MMKSTLQRGLITLTATTMVILGNGCSSNSSQLNSTPAKRIMQNEQQSTQPIQEGSIPISRVEGIPYVTGNDLSSILHFQTHWDAGSGSFVMGDYDAAYEVWIGSVDAKSEGVGIKIPQSPILYNSMVYIPVTSLGTLFQNVVQFDVMDHEVHFYPLENGTNDPMEGPEEPDTGSEMDFGEDPQDLLSGSKEDSAGTTAKDSSRDPISLEMPVFSSKWGNTDGVPTVSRKIDRMDILQNVKRYLGVKYVFAAAPYPQSGTFDCSSLTQYVFERYGVTLERTAIQQSTQGKTVNRKELRKGDLLFFNVPGRYKSKRVGHVAIYLGNNTMIHAAPEPKNGVQITSINNKYWKETFLKAQRMID